MRIARNDHRCLDSPYRTISVPPCRCFWLSVKIVDAYNEAGIRAPLSGGRAKRKKQRILKEAAEILSILATRFDSARKERKNVLDARGAMEVKVRAALQENFATLTFVPDHVAFDATASEYQIKNLLTLADLKDAIKENDV